MKKIISVLLALVLCFSMLIVPVGAIEGTYVAYFVGETQDGDAVTGLNAGETYLPERMPVSATPDGKYFVGWADKDGKIVSNEGFALSNGENKLYAVYKEFYAQVNADLKNAVPSTLARNIGFMKNGAYNGQVVARSSGSAALKYVESGENYLEVYPGASNAGGTVIPLSDADGDVIQAKWNTKYNVTVVYRIPENESTAALKVAFGGQINRTTDTYHQAPYFRNQYGNEGGNIKLGNYWSVTADSGLTSKWHDNGGYQYRFGSSVENPATTDGWKSVTFSGTTGAENTNFLPLFGLYVSVGPNTAKQKVQIKSVTVVDVSNAVVKYVANGQTDSMATGIAVGETYMPDRMPSLSAPEGKYFVGWADEGGNIITEGISVEGGETVLYAVYKDYPGKENMAFNWDNFAATSGVKRVYAPSVDENGGNYQATTNAYNRGYGVVNTVTENGETYLKPTVTTTWGQRQAIILADNNGVAYQVKPDTKYTVTVTYKVPNFVSSNAIAVAAGLNIAKRANAGEPESLCKYYASATYTDPSITSSWVYNVWKNGGYNDYRINAASENWQTITFSLDIADTQDTLPVIVLGIELGGMSDNKATELLIKDVTIRSSDYKEPVSVKYYDGDNLILEESVTDGSNIREEGIEVEGKIFVGWYSDKELTIPALPNVNGETALYGKYVSKDDTINVKYIYNGEVLKDAPATLYSKIWNGKNAVDGKTLFGWYTDEALTQRYTLATVEMTDLVLYGDFVDYTTDYQETSWPTHFSSINIYSEYNDTIMTSFSAGGWNWGDAAKLNYNDCLLLANRNTWGQGGGVILHDAETGDVLVPEPSSLYEVSIEYTVPKLDAKNVTVSLGFGYDKAKANSLSNISPNVSQQVGEFEEVTNEIQTATFTYNVPENTGDILPCFVISASFGGRKDATNSAPVSYIAISKVTVKKVEIKGLSYGGASVLKEEVAEELNEQALRVYFDYTLDDEGKFIAADLLKYNIKERGIIMKGDGVSDASLVLDNVGKDGVRGIRKTGGFDKGWLYDAESGKVTFSMRVSGLEMNDTRRIKFRGYVVLDNNMICYSDTSTISVNDIKNAVDTDSPKGDEKEKIAILMVIGQSNAQGAGFSEEMEIVKVTNGMWEMSAMPTTTDYGAVYLSNTGAVTSLSPAYEYSTNWAERVGGYGPALAARWHELTGDKVVVLQMAVGATGLAEWQKDANSNREHYKELSTPGDDRGYNGEYYLYKRAVKAFNETYEALSGNYEITTAFYTWNQGENAESRTNPDENTIYDDATYAEYYEKMHNDFMADCPGLEFGAITAVRSCRNTSHSQKKWNVAGVTTNARRAQYRLASKLDDIFFVSWHTEDARRTAPGSFQTNGISEPTWGGNYDLVPSFKGCSYAFSNMHMTQLNYNIIGKESAENILASLNGNVNFDGVAVRDGDANLVGKFGVDGSGKFSITDDNTTRTQYLQIRPEDATCTYDFSLSVDVNTKQIVIDLYTDGSHHASGDDYVTEYGEINWAKLNELGIDTLDIVCNVR